jgi:hypothetical protein
MEVTKKTLAKIADIDEGNKSEIAVPAKKSQSLEDDETTNFEEKLENIEIILAAKNESSENKVKFCRSCGVKQKAASEFCHSCGEPAFYQGDFTPKEVEASSSPENNTEAMVVKGIDGLFSLLYIYLIYILVFTDDLEEGDLGAAGAMFGLLIAFGVLYFVQKLSKSILGTIARSFDEISNKNR